ncbi:hypothetical protein ABZ897_49970 [Nonomuraea sp. NPDC046802]|uniref:hypothetical protein n=1 Tax=Nonomuraea sp. NPDC046802 TaxID=3154919 RepID=UPI0033F85349
MLFIRPDVVAVKLRQEYYKPDGTDVGSPLWIMAKEDGQWLLTASQNIDVPDDEDVSPDCAISGAAGEARHRQDKERSHHRQTLSHVDLDGQLSTRRGSCWSVKVWDEILIRSPSQGRARLGRGSAGSHLD